MGYIFDVNSFIINKSPSKSRSRTFKFVTKTALSTIQSLVPGPRSLVPASWFLFPVPCPSVRLQLLQRQPHAKARRSRLGPHADVPAVLADDAHGVVEA